MPGETPSPTPAPAPAPNPTPAPSPSPASVSGSLLGAEPNPPGGEAAAPKGTQAPTDAAPGADVELKLPEGWKSDDRLVGNFKGVAKELGLDSAKAQKLFDLHVGAVAESQKQIAAGWEKQVADWETAARADKEYGGASFDSNLEIARRAVERLGGPGLRQFLAESGMGNNPELIRFAVRAGKAISEDSIGGDAGSAPKNADPEAAYRAMYPSMYPKEK